MPPLLALIDQTIAAAATTGTASAMPAPPAGLRLNPTDQVVAFVAAAPLIYLATVALGRSLKRRAGVQLSVMYKLFGVSLALYIPMKVLGWDAGAYPYELRRDLRAVCILLGVIFILSLLKRYLWEFYFGEKRRMEIPKFLREIFSAIFFCITLLLVCSRVYHIQPSGVLFSSTVVVGIIGWAMQDLLGNVISGVALQIGKPFKAGDWLIIEPHHAEVIEVNWRSTRLRTNDDTYLDVPNTAIVRSTVVNLSYPSHLHAMRMRVGIAYEAPPNKVKHVLLAAAAGAGGRARASPSQGLPRRFCRLRGDLRDQVLDAKPRRLQRDQRRAAHGRLVRPPARRHRHSVSHPHRADRAEARYHVPPAG